MKNNLFFKKMFSIFLQHRRTLSSEYSFLFSMFQFLKSLQACSSSISIFSMQLGLFALFFFFSFLKDFYFGLERFENIGWIWIVTVEFCSKANKARIDGSLVFPIIIIIIIIQTLLLTIFLFLIMTRHDLCENSESSWTEP